MKRAGVVVLAVLVAIGVLAPSSFAQGPAPKVTINGLVDFVTTAGMNLAYTNNQTGMSPNLPDGTVGNKEKGWRSRERGVFAITREVRRVQGGRAGALRV